MKVQPEALRLADQIHHGNGEWMQQAAAELRRLYAEVDRLSYQLAYPDNFLKEAELRRVLAEIEAKLKEKNT